MCIRDRSDAVGVVPPEVIFTPSGFSGAAPTIVPLSLVAGATTNVTVTFTVENPMPVNGKIIFEVPNTFTNVDASSVSITSGIDGGIAFMQSGGSPVYDNTLKTSGGPWVVTFIRDGSGSIVAAGDTVVVVMAEVINQQHEGSSGTFPMFKTTLSDGTTAIDESSSEADAIGILPPAVVFTPSGFSSVTPTITPVSYTHLTLPTILLV